MIRLLYSLTASAAVYAAAIIFVRPLLLLFPAFGFFVILSSVIDSLAVRLFVSVAGAAAWWIAGYPLLSVIPVQTDAFMYVSAFAGLAFACIRFSRKMFTYTAHDLITLCGAGVLIAGFFAFYRMQAVPAGADMATHTYTARVILENSGFPRSYEPVIPVSTFGFAPYGLSVLIAFLAKVSNLEIYRSAMFVTAMVYPLTAAGLYVFLQRFLTMPAAAFTVMFVLLVERDLVRYIEWGGNPTPLSVGFIAFGLAAIFFLHNSKKTSVPLRLIAAIFFAAAFYTHPTPFAVAAAYLLAAAPVLYVSGKRYFLGKTVFPVLVIIGILILPFIPKITAIPDQTIDIVRSHTRAEYFNIVPSAEHILPSTGRFILNHLGDRFMMMVLLGLIVAIIRKNSLVIWFVSAIAVTAALIVNSAYWFLPLSGLFYPDRVLTVGLLAFSGVAGIGVDYVFGLLKKSGRYVPYVPGLFMFLWVSVLSVYMLNQADYIISRVIMYQSREKASVTDDDLRVFTWIRLHTDPGDVIANNYGDAGVWLPAIAERMVTWNDFHLHYGNELENRQQALTPAYLFIGEKPVYSGGIRYVHADIRQDSMYQEVFSSGGSALYRVVGEQ